MPDTRGRYLRRRQQSDSPGSWEIITQPGGGYSNPAKANILDSYWGFQHVTGSPAFLYLAFTREKSGGDTFITFELNQEAQLWHPHPPPSPGIPCRTTGDLLITFQPESSHNEDSFKVEEWITADNGGAVDPGGSGCATAGTFEELSFATPPSPDANFEAAFNAAPIQNFLPPTSVTTIDTANFGEASINLSAVLTGDQDGCSKFTSIWMYSQSSSAGGQSQMQDYVAPTPFLVRTCKATPDLSSTASGSVNSRARGKHHLRRHARLVEPLTDTAHLSGGDNPTGTITFDLYGPGNDTCTGPPLDTSTVPVSGNGDYHSKPFTPTATGVYRWQVRYSGDNNNHGDGPTECGIDSETTEISPPPSPVLPTLTTVASNATVLGSPISDTATLNNGFLPTGTITFDVYGPDVTSCTPAAARSSTVSVHGNGPYTSAEFTPTKAGTYLWVAKYSGDTHNLSVTTHCGETGESVVVRPAPPPAAPSISSTASAGGPVGSPIQDTAHLGGGSSPTGTITFRVYGPNDAACVTPAAPPSTVPASGAGDYQSASFTPIAAGKYRWVATYSGDANNAAAATACGDAAETVDVSRAQPTLRTAASPVVVRSGHAAGDTATLTGGANPQRTITFRLYGPNDSTCSAPPVFVAEQTVNGDGSYRSPAATPAVAGTYRWVATYSGDANNAAAATACGDAGETVVVQRGHATQLPEETTRPRPKPHRPPKPIVTG